MFGIAVKKAMAWRKNTWQKRTVLSRVSPAPVMVWMMVSLLSCGRVVWVGDAPPDTKDSDHSLSDDTETETADSDFTCLAADGNENLNIGINFIIAVDTSGGMEDEVSAVASALNPFFDQLMRYGVETTLILVSADSSAKTGICLDPPLGNGECPDDSNAPAYIHIAHPVGSKDALTKLVSTYSDWKGALSDAPVAFLVVSDDDSDRSGDDFREELAALNPPITSFLFYGIAAAVAKPEACKISDTAPCCLYSAKEGTIYKALAETTSGLFEDICAQDVSGDMAAIARDAAETLCRLDVI